MDPYKCYLHSIYSLFPRNINNKKYVYQVNILHIIGVLLVQIGQFVKQGGHLGITASFEGISMEN